MLRSEELVSATVRPPARMAKIFSFRSCAALVAILVIWLSPVARADDIRVSCTSVSVPVSALAVPSAMAGTLCIPASGPHTVLVLVPGSTYNQSYWDYPYQSGTYSFRRAMNRAGYATLAIDRIGTGRSSRPPSALVTALGQADAVHRVIGRLRDGRIGPTSFRKIILGGHSLGSGIAVHEAALYHDIDALLLTGFSHEVDPIGSGSVVAGFYPADADPKFAGRGYDPGYLTTRPGTRKGDFYAQGDFDARVVAVDETTKDIVTSTEFADGLSGSLPPETNLISAPTMIVNGSEDKLACSSLLRNCASAATLSASEQPFFQVGCLTADLLQGSGHDVNLAANTETYQAAVVRWADLNVGTSEPQQRVRTLPPLRNRPSPVSPATTIGPPACRL